MLAALRCTSPEQAADAFLQFLSKAFKGDPREGQGDGRGTRTLTRASVQAARTNKRLFSK